MRKDHDIYDLEERNQKLTEMINSFSFECSPVETKKIADLSRENRHLTSQLMSVKVKLRELDSKNHQLEDALDEKEKLLEEKIKNEEPASPSEIQILQDSVDKTKKKLFEVSNLNVQLKNELKMAQKCLQQELGVESVSVSQLLNSQANWRGRAEQILMLQSKIAELKEKIDNTDCDAFYDISTSSSRLSIKRLDSVRKMEIDSLTKELEKCKQELDELKKKVGGLKARNKNISDESNSYKLKTLELMEKTKNDDDYIKCLNEKIAMTKFECDHKINEMKGEVTEINQLRDASQLEIQKIQTQLEHMSEVMTDKNNEIANLNLANKELENNVREFSGDFLFSCRDMSKKDFVDLIKALECEKHNLSNMIKDLNERLNKQFQLQNEQHEITAKQRVKIARLEGRVKEFEKEKEEMKNKHRRNIRINEYSRSMSGQNIANQPTTIKSHERATSEIERFKFK